MKKTNHNKQKTNNEEEWENTVIFNKFREQFNNEEEKKKNEQVQKQIKYVVEKLPKSLQNSMITLAHRAQTKVKTSEQDIEQLSQEVETWFN
uniref:hypothetical protein n=1 Tax=Cyanothece sp. BG0011 TaxID=2082950 RepID=UPI001300A823